MHNKKINIKKNNTNNKNNNQGIKKNVETLFFHNTYIKLFYFYRYIPFHWKILVVILMSFIVGTFSLFFIKNTGLYSTGISALTQGISRFVCSIMSRENISASIISIVSDLLFWFLIVLVNIPMLFFSYKKIGKKFTILTTIYLFSSSIFSYSLNQIPDIEKVLIFGDINSHMNSHMVTNEVYDIVFLTWLDQDLSKVIPLFFYGVTFSILSVVFYSIIYILGGSTAGADIISIYWFKKKLKPLSEMIFITNFTFLFSGHILGSYCSIGLLHGGSWGYTYFFGPNLVCSIILNIIFSIFINILYPRYKLISVRCIGKNAKKINKKLDEIGYIHSRTITEVMSSNPKRKKYSIIIYCFYFELEELMNLIRKIDNKIFIAINKNVEINGKMSIQRFIE